MAAWSCSKPALEPGLWTAVARYRFRAGSSLPAQLAATTWRNGRQQAGVGQSGSKLPHSTAPAWQFAPCCHTDSSLRAVAQRMPTSKSALPPGNTHSLSRGVGAGLVLASRYRQGRCNTGRPPEVPLRSGANGVCPAAKRPRGSHLATAMYAPPADLSC